jgi:hypothetical protein
MMISLLIQISTSPKKLRWALIIRLALLNNSRYSKCCIFTLYGADVAFRNNCMCSVRALLFLQTGQWKLHMHSTVCIPDAATWHSICCVSMWFSFKLFMFQWTIFKLFLRWKIVSKCIVVCFNYNFCTCEGEARFAILLYIVCLQLLCSACVPLPCLLPDLSTLYANSKNTLFCVYIHTQLYSVTMKHTNRWKKKSVKYGCIVIKMVETFVI